MTTSKKPITDWSLVDLMQPLNTYNGTTSAWRAAILWYLVARGNVENRVWPRIEVIAKECGCSVTVASKTMKELIEMGALKEVPYEQWSTEQDYLKNNHKWAKKVWQLTGVCEIEGKAYKYLHFFTPSRSNESVDSGDSLIDGIFQIPDILESTDKHIYKEKKEEHNQENTYQPQASELPVSDKKSVVGVESEETGVDSNQVQPSSGEKPKTPQTAKGKPAEKIITLSPNNGGSAAPDLPADMLGKLAALRQWLADTPQPPHERAFKGFTHHPAYKAMETVLKATSHPAKRDGMQLGSVLHQLWKIENSDVFKVLDFLEWYHIKTNYTLPKKWDAWFGYADGRKGNYMLWLEEKAKKAAPVVSDMALRADENCPRCHGKGSVVKSSPDKYAVEMIFEAEPCSCLQRRKLDSLAS